MIEPTIFHVKPQQVGKQELQEFLRQQISKQFQGKEYIITKELIEEKRTHYSSTPRKLRGFLINEADKIGHSIWFDVTECQGGIDWIGR